MLALVSGYVFSVSTAGGGGAIVITGGGAGLAASSRRTRLVSGSGTTRTTRLTATALTGPEPRPSASSTRSPTPTVVVAPSSTTCWALVWTACGCVSRGSSSLKSASATSSTDVSNVCGGSAPSGMPCTRVPSGTVA